MPEAKTIDLSKGRGPEAAVEAWLLFRALIYESIFGLAGAAQHASRLRLCRCLPKTLFAKSKAIEIKSALSARPEDVSVKTDQREKGETEMGLKNGFRVRLAADARFESLIQLPSLPVVAQESFLCSASAARHDCRASAAAAGAHKPKRHSRRRRADRASDLRRARAHTAALACRGVPPASAAATAPQAKPWPPRQSAGARARRASTTSTNLCSTSSPLLRTSCRRCRSPGTINPKRQDAKP